MKTLYLFIDESGNFDFTKSGTKHFVLTCLSTTNPVVFRRNLLKIKYDLLSKGINQEFFHATEDKQIVRDEVFKILSKLNDTEVFSIISNKSKVKPKLYKESYVKKGKKIKRTTGFYYYSLLTKKLLGLIFHENNTKELGKIVIILGAIFTKDKQSQILKVLKKYLKKHFEIPFDIYFHKSESDLNSQIADYFCWAIYVKYERNEKRPFNVIKNKIKKMTNPSILSEEPRGSY